MRNPRDFYFSSEILHQRFKEFLDPDADRYLTLKSLLDELYLSPQGITISGNRHLFLSSQGAISNRLKERSQGEQHSIVLVAHYDRVPNSPGANDNGAAVFELVEAAVKLRKEKVHRWLIIFTDKEEIAHGESIRDQGAYTLAKGLQDAGLGNSRYYIFDACGVGDTLIISTMADYLMKQEERLGIARARMQVRQLRTKALETARHLRMDRVRLIPTPFSDDAGFLRAGIPAQTITMLPAAEAGTFGALLRNKPDFAEVLVNREAQDKYDTQLIPETWRLLNGPEDKGFRLTPQHFSLVVRFICGLCKANCP
ncbi:MAG: Zn-dependent exopeptidase M28 [Spirochaetaceae bacterium]|nr:Zn-dependent exopeptidase M28 [Spirochaetaceae bacterium]